MNSAHEPDETALATPATRRPTGAVVGLAMLVCVECPDPIEDGRAHVERIDAPCDADAPPDPDLDLRRPRGDPRAAVR